MTKDVVMFEEGNTIAEAAQKMSDNNLSCLIINKSHPDDSYGIITRRDIVNKMIAPGRDPSHVKVSEIMTKPLMMVPPSITVQHIAKLMVQTKIRRMPVFDGANLVGIVSNTDVFKGYCRFLSNEKAFLS